MNRRINIGLVLFLVAVCAGGVWGIKHWVDCQYGLCPISESWGFDGLRLTLSSPKRQYEVGEEVTVAVKVENITLQTIQWKSLSANKQDYVFDVEVDGIWLSSVYPELQVFNREMKPGEIIEITYTFKPENQEPHGFSLSAYIYGNGQSKSSVSLPYALSYGVSGGR